MALQPEAGDVSAETPDVVAFARSVLGISPSSLQEIGNGNLNRVFRAVGRSGNVIVKMAVPYVWSVGLHWPLTTDRVRAEARAYLLHESFAPGLLPKLLAHDNAGAMIALEDLQEFDDWRSAMLAGRRTGGVGRVVGDYVRSLVAATSPAVIGPDRAEAIRRDVGNPMMQAFTERMVFTAPYVADRTNRWPADLRHAEDHVRADPQVRQLADRARWMFLTRAECLTHGDLHSGSIMVNDDQGAVRVIDLEFANYGPIAFDIGTFIAHLVFPRIRAAVLGDAELVAYLDAEAHEFWASLASALPDVLGLEGASARRFVEQLVDDTAVFVSVELLRRLGGYFNVADIKTLDAAELREAERRLFAAWQTAAMPHVGSFDALWTALSNRTEGPA